MLKTVFKVIKHTLVGVMEAAAFAIMVSASVILHSMAGTVMILVEDPRKGAGLLVGVIGLAIYNVWQV